MKLYINIDGKMSGVCLCNLLSEFNLDIRNCGGVWLNFVEDWNLVK